MHRALEHPNDQYRHEILKNHLHNVLLLAMRTKQLQPTSIPRKGIALDYTLLLKGTVERKFLTLKTVAGYAELLCVPEKRLAQATAKVLGKTPKAMIDDRVLLEAKRMLMHSSLAIKEIGYRLGFEEPTNFIKYFRKHTSSTPAEFREKYLG
jgi:AraC-like DNA-binding protein